LESACLEEADEDDDGEVCAAAATAKESINAARNIGFMLDLTTLKLVPQELIVSKLLALREPITIGCKTAGARVL
jgi:hypothetical protein